MITLTLELIELLRTPKGGFNKETIEIIGAGWPMQAGWRERLVGTKIGDRRWDQAVKAKNTERYFSRGNAGRRR